MKFYSTPSFLRCFNKLNSSKQDSVREAIDKLMHVYSMTAIVTQGMGIKKLRNNLWEMRSTLKERILFSVADEIISFVLVGNHDDVRKYLKNL